MCGANNPKLSHGHRRPAHDCNCDNQISYQGRNSRRGGRWLQRGVRRNITPGQNPRGMKVTEANLRIITFCLRSRQKDNLALRMKPTLCELDQSLSDALLLV